MANNSDDKQNLDKTPQPMMDDQRGEQQANARRDEHAEEPLPNRQHGGDVSRTGVERNRNGGGFDGKR